MTINLLCSVIWYVGHDNLAILQPKANICLTIFGCSECWLPLNVIVLIAYIGMGEMTINPIHICIHFRRNGTWIINDLLLYQLINREASTKRWQFSILIDFHLCFHSASNKYTANTKNYWLNCRIAREFITFLRK